MRQRNILVVDDEPHIVQLIRLTLEPEFKVTEAYTSKDAMNTLKTVNPDLILLDIMMPGEDGFKLCSRIRDISKFKDTPIVFISAKAQTADKMKSLDVGADDYITKPFDPKELEKKVKSNLIMSKI